MLTTPRLSLFEPRSLAGAVKHAAAKQLFGFMPAALHVYEPQTDLGAKPLFIGLLRESNRPSADWSRPELELLNAFVSDRNGCVF